MWRAVRTAGTPRDRLAVLLALLTVAGLVSAFFLSKGTQLLMPGPLASAHGTIEKCSTCHTKSGSGKLSWVHGLAAGDPLADSKACITCHKMSDAAFNAHGASSEVLKKSNERMPKIAAQTPQPQSARAQSIAFPTHDVVARGLNCATCHQEHHGVNFNLSKISNEQCRSCHVVKFDSFDGHHPKFENYPFKRRTRIIYDHAGHFSKHFPEVAKKDPERRIPATCANCHDSHDDKRVMAVAKFEQTCTACHLDQITGKERVSGPKGIAFLSVPGLDLQTLMKKKAAIGEWPAESEAELTAFMKVMISRDERGRDLIKAVNKLNLQDLSNASDDQIKAVTSLVWEIKGLFYALIKGKTSDILGNIDIGGGARLSPSLVADLIASIPRDVVIGAHQQWLPNLATEMANRPIPTDPQPGGWNTVTKESQLDGPASQKERSGSDARQVGPRPSPEAAERAAAAGKSDLAKGKTDGKETPRATQLPPPMRAGVQDAERVAQADGAAEEAEGGGAIGGRWNLPSGTPRSIKAGEDTAKVAEPEEAPGKADPAKPKSNRDKKAPSADEQPPASKAGSKDEEAAPPGGASGETDSGKTKSDDGKETPSVKQPQDSAADQTDDLLFPTEAELRAIKGDGNDAEKAAPSDGAAVTTDSKNAKANSAAPADAASEADANAPADARAGADAAMAEPQTKVAPVISIESNVDPESWAEYGGWYRQDYAIYYRPTGHKDKFIYSWLFLTGPQAPKGATSPAAAVFEALTIKDAQGSCTKCHSVDEIQGKGRLVNFSPTSVESKRGGFTNFIHEPHFGIMENRGCLTCHELEKGRPYLKSYEQGNPQNYQSNFGEVKKDLCQTCHTSSMARQDCLLCHKYHVNGVITPIINTKIPAQ